MKARSGIPWSQRLTRRVRQLLGQPLGPNLGPNLGQNLGQNLGRSRAWSGGPVSGWIGSDSQTRRLAQQAAGYAAASRDLPGAIVRENYLSLKYAVSTGQPLVQVLPQALGLVATAVYRAHQLVPHRVQLQGGIEMALGRIVEMKTGEGKTLTASFATAVHALAGKGCHVATVNDYLAQRDAEFSAPILQQLGLSVGVLAEGMEADARRTAYARDVTYATAKELGFDFLRDRLGLHTSPVHRGLHFVLVDEADSILIDEARTPLIIGLVSPESEIVQACYRWAAEHASEFLLKRDYRYIVQQQKIELLPAGILRLRRLPQNGQTRQVSIQSLCQYMENAIRAWNEYQLDRHYVIDEGKVMLIDQYNGRPADGRQWQGGLHQAVEAKERVAISPMNRSAARITLQNFFLRYQQFGGMTGTAWDSRHELKVVYRKQVTRIPTHRPVNRTVLAPRIFSKAADKWQAIMAEIQRMIAAGRPVLAGTRNIDCSEELAALLREKNIVHQVLNARRIEQEAQIIAAAGQPGRVTVATNMAGRGTDIKLAPQVAAAGGLHVILSEIHPAARIDWQLIGRGSRQGDPGSYRIYASFEDEILEMAWQKSGQRRLQQKYQKFQQLPPRILKVFLKAQHVVQRRHASDRMILMRNEKDRRESCLQAGQDPYLAFNE